MYCDQVERKRERENGKKKRRVLSFGYLQNEVLLYTEVHGGRQQHRHQTPACIAAMMPFVHFHPDSTMRKQSAVR